MTSLAALAPRCLTPRPSFHVCDCGTPRRTWVECVYAIADNYEPLKFSKNTLVQNWGDRWDSNPLRTAPQADASTTSASTTMAGHHKQEGDRRSPIPFVRPKTLRVRANRLDIALAIRVRAWRRREIRAADEHGDSDPHCCGFLNRKA